jgi:hypothetical protein
MRTVELLRVLSPVFMIVAIALLATRRRLIRSFELVEATSPGSAIAVSPGSPIGRWWVSRLTRLGVLQANPDGTIWLDGVAWAAYRSTRRRRAVTVIIVILLSMTLLAVLHRGS